MDSNLNSSNSSNSKVDPVYLYNKFIKELKNIKDVSRKNIGLIIYKLSNQENDSKFLCAVRIKNANNMVNTPVSFIKKYKIDKIVEKIGIKLNFGKNAYYEKHNLISCEILDIKHLDIYDEEEVRIMEKRKPPQKKSKNPKRLRVKTKTRAKPKKKRKKTSQPLYTPILDEFPNGVQIPPTFFSLENYKRDSVDAITQDLPTDDESLFKIIQICTSNFQNKVSFLPMVLNNTIENVFDLDIVDIENCTSKQMLADVQKLIPHITMDTGET